MAHKLLMKKLIAALVFVQFLYSMPALASVDLSEYGYEQRVQFSPIDTIRSVSVQLTKEALTQVNNKFSNIHLINARNEAVPFMIHYRAQSLIQEIEQMTVSSIKAGNDPFDLLDNNRLTKFNFDEKVDGADASTIVVDFGRILDLHRIRLWTPSGARINGMEIKVGTDKNRLKIIKNKSAFTKVIDGNFPLARFVEISLWGPSVKLEDVLFYERPVAEVYFEAVPGMSYKLLSGNPAINFIQFASRLSAPKKSDVKAVLSPSKLNKFLTPDIDKDGFDNEADNCPFVSNRGQKDNDSDGFGDDCDNAPIQKNYDQSDVDRDGIADIIDNCKNHPNPGQYDKDDDNIGDACDAGDNSGAKAEAKIEAITSKTTSPLLILGVLAMLLISFGAWFATKKKN